MNYKNYSPCGTFCTGTYKVKIVDAKSYPQVAKVIAVKPRWPEAKRGEARRFDLEIGSVVYLYPKRG